MKSGNELNNKKKTTKIRVNSNSGSGHCESFDKLRTGSCEGARQSRSIRYALWLLGRRAYTQKQMREKLERKKFETAEIEATLGRLLELEFLNDLEFAKNFIRQSTLGKPKGVRRVRFELLRKGVEKETIERAIAEGNFAENEGDLATQALARYGKKFEKYDRQKRYEKSIRFLLGRGFSYDVAKKAINNLSIK